MLKWSGVLRSWGLLLVMALALCGEHASAYSVLTHEELIDLAWNESIRPLLLARFPGATDAELVRAHAYAYGGSAIQDMGYYPFGKKFFSSLTHYARTGDFIEYLVRNARTIDELAFAIGALSHYIGDSIGHLEAVNPATGLEFPKLRKKYGKFVTYGESPHGHIRTEFAFDIDELSHAEFAPDAYLERIGFLVPGEFLEEAFYETYGFDMHEVLGEAHPALRSYTTSVRRFIPLIARSEVVLHRRQFHPHLKDEAYQKFIERVKRTNYQRRWRHAYRGPGFRAHLMAILVFVVPKVGAFSDLAIKIPSPDSEDMYLKSVNHAVDSFCAALNKLRAGASAPLDLANLDLDTGGPAALGDYALADDAYAALLTRLTSKPSRAIREDLKQNIIDYYTPAASIVEDPGRRVNAELEVLRGMPTVNAQAESLISSSWK